MDGETAQEQKPQGQQTPRKRLKVRCLRCGMEWRPKQGRVPTRCCRCQTLYWNEPPEPGSRRPEDPPAPSWPQRTGAKRGRPVGGSKHAESPAPPEHQPSTFGVQVRPPTVPFPRPLTFIPPNVSSILPPPPPITLPPPPAPRFDPSPPQPELARAPAPPPLPAPEPAPEAAIDTSPAIDPIPPEEITQRADRGDMLEAAEPPAEVSFDESRQPRSDAEREELAKANASAWPVTRSDDYE